MHFHRKVNLNKMWDNKNCQYPQNQDLHNLRQNS